MQIINFYPKKIKEPLSTRSQRLVTPTLLAIFEPN